MNKKQQIVLIVGAIALFISVLTVPKVITFKGSTVGVSRNAQRGRMDVGNAMIRVVTVLGATGLIWFAFKNKGK